MPELTDDEPHIRAQVYAELRQMRTADEIESQLRAAAEFRQSDQFVNHYAPDDYQAGVESALEWVLGRQDQAPIPGGETDG
jgi:hypothetical protein